MMDLSKEEFDRMKDESARRIKEIYKGSHMPPYPSFVSLPEKAKAKEPEEANQAPTPNPPEPRYQNTRQSNFAGNIFRFLNLEELTKTPDTLLILGLLLLLISDNADEKLILALIFIML